MPLTLEKPTPIARLKEMLGKHYTIFGTTVTLKDFTNHHGIVTITTAEGTEYRKKLFMLGDWLDNFEPAKEEREPTPQAAEPSLFAVAEPQPVPAPQPAPAPALNGRLRLKVYDTSTVQAPKAKGEPFLSVTRGGSFALSKSAAEALGIKHGDRIALAQDEFHPRDWYLVTGAPKGFLLRGNKRGAPIFASINLARALFRSLGQEPRNVQIPIVTEPAQPGTYPILTSTLKK